MNKLFKLIVPIAFMLGSGVATAQVTTLTYEGNPLDATFVTYMSDPPTEVTTPFNGSVIASITLDGSLSSNDLALVSYDASAGGFSFDAVPCCNTPIPGDTAFVIPGVTIYLATTNGAITGATLDFYSYQTYGLRETVSIGGPSGDNIAAETSNPFGTGTGLYGSNGSPGVWTVASAPEINPSSSATALTLLLGGLAIVRRRNLR